MKKIQKNEKEENIFELVRDNFGNLLIIKEIIEIQNKLIEKFSE